MKPYFFPKDFIWGTSTSAHQTEGNNINSDWWEWENSKKYFSPDSGTVSEREFPLEPSGIACDSYNRYEEDFDLCVDLNNNAVRISIEWARIEPEHGKFDENEIEHYKKVLKAARARGLKTFVTLHHFTNPIWFSKIGGWTNINSPSYFAKYAKKCAEEFHDLIDVFLTINEPQVYVYMSYFHGIWPPNKMSTVLSLWAQINLARANNKAYDAIKGSPYKEGVAPKIGIVKNIVWYEASMSSKNPLDKLIAKILHFIGSDFFFLMIKNKFDLIGLNYYFTNRIENLRTKNPDDVVNDLGWWIYPKGLFNILLSLKKYNVEIYITENGLADDKDEKREYFIREMLKSCSEAIQKGVNLKGYFHWSLLDNYEWHHGFWPCFGLIRVDRKTLERTKRPSFKYYSEICKTGELKL